jgi:hypothetical protein
MAAVAIGLLGATGALAASREINQVPTGWKLENYPGNGVVLWHAAPECSNGKLALPTSATADDRQRFWSLVLSAIVANHKLFVRYESTTCKMTSFGMYGE